MEIHVAIREGAADRLRPVLITALVASIGYFRWRSRPKPEPRFRGLSPLRYWGLPPACSLEVEAD